jgi:hypothetical protein
MDESLSRRSCMKIDTSWVYRFLRYWSSSAPLVSRFGWAIWNIFACLTWKRAYLYLRFTHMFLARYLRDETREVRSLSLCQEFLYSGLVSKFIVVSGKLMFAYYLNKKSIGCKSLLRLLKRANLNALSFFNHSHTLLEIMITVNIFFKRIIIRLCFVSCFLLCPLSSRIWHMNLRRKLSYSALDVSYQVRKLTLWSVRCRVRLEFVIVLLLLYCWLLVHI